MSSCSNIFGAPKLKCAWFVKFKIVSMFEVASYDGEGHQEVGLYNQDHSHFQDVLKNI